MFVLSVKNGDNDPTRDVLIGITFHSSKTKVLIPIDQ